MRWRAARAVWRDDTAPEARRGVAASDVIVLAVKPQQMRDVALRLQSQLDARPLVLSIAAGIRGATCRAGWAATAPSCAPCRTRRR
jgi:pyrroline-5-carboxylate reductase